MLALVYIFLCFWIGIEVVDWLVRSVRFPKVLSRFWVVVGGGYLVGTIFLTWATYMMAYLFRGTGKLLFWGNLIVMSIAVVGFLWRKPWKRRRLVLAVMKRMGKRKLEVGLLLGLLLLVSFVMFDSFRIVNEKIQVGLSVFGDFGPHLAMIRSFSFGSNFPTGYPHFPSDQIKYHFMFQFLAGNLEFLGLRLDMALNIPSILSLTASLMLLYALAVKLTGKRLVGVLVIIMFWFRSAYAFFGLINETGSLHDLWQKIINSQFYIGNTGNESWGLWTINVYANQRHFGMAIGVMFLVILIMSDLVGDGVKKIKDNFFRKNWFSREAWLVKNYQRPIVTGVILGLLTYWNAAVVIATLVILAGMMLLARRKFEFLIVILITLGLGQLQKYFFIGFGGESIKPELAIGFLAEDKGFLGIWRYYGELLGVMPIIFGLGLLIGSNSTRLMGLVFLGPLLLATLVKLTPDVPVGHKYVMVTVMLSNIIGAGLLDKLIRSRKLIPILLSGLLFLELTVTGVVDWITFHNMNRSNLAFKFEVNDEVVDWVRQNTRPDEVFLTDTFFFNPILFAGRKIFYGWPYYAWSAGYNTLEREGVVKSIYAGEDFEETRSLLLENGIDYVVIDDSNRTSPWHRVNEDLFEKNFKLVYINAGRGNMKVFRVE
jgi:hypothetical protein